MTGVLGPGRVPKHDLRVETVGSIDEAAAALGVARSLADDVGLREILETMQRHLYQVMAETAAPGDAEARFRTIGPEQIEWLEAQMEGLSGEAVPPTGFLLGGDTRAAGALDLARTVVRRAERRMAQLVDAGGIENRHLLRYLNRASSMCFVLILVECRRRGISPTMARL